ncbi:hypothetical protein V8B97DRAFT_2046088 [Scleroderma yunnanense]
MPVTTEHTADVDYCASAHLTECYCTITGAMDDKWPAFFAAIQTNMMDKKYFNATASVTPIPNLAFVPVPIDSNLCYYLASKKPLPVGHPLFNYQCFDCDWLGHWHWEHNLDQLYWEPDMAFVGWCGRPLHVQGKQA